MPLTAGHAVRRRDERLWRTRRVSLWVAGGAAAASLGLGTAFAHALPGHRTAAAGAQPAGAGQVQRGAGQVQPGAGQTAPSSAAAPARRHGHRQSLVPPQQPPATTQAPPQAVSGGS
jgi:hypothetical protein